MVIALEYYDYRKVNQRFVNLPKARRRCLTIGSVVGSFVVSPVLAVMAVGQRHLLLLDMLFVRIFCELRCSVVFRCL